MKSKQMKRRLFGYSTRQVNHHIRRFKQLQAFELEDLQQKIQAAKNKNQELRKQIGDLQAQMHQRTMLQELAELLHQRCNETILAIRSQGELEKSEIENAIQIKKIEHENNMKKMEQQTNYYNGFLQSFLQEFFHSIGNIMNREVSDVLKVQLKEIAATISYDQLELNEKLLGEDIVLEEDDPVFHSTNVIRFKLQSLKDLQNAQQLEKQNSVVCIDPDHDEMVLSEEPMDEETTDSHDELPEVKHSQFWGDIQAYIQDTSSKTSVSANVETNISNVAEKLQIAEQPSITTDSGGWEQPQMDPLPIDDTFDKKEIQSDAKESTKESHALSEEIEAVRNRYIVGKLSGIDLYDTNGQLIIGKNQSITKEVVSQADRAGKLADLIVHMLLPGMRDSNDKD
ncbi:hypothetical protein LSG31_13985 [Fodinisporobacter ferrooxydans]|uniref:Uncharacterized protein n=1 Tax=Fodinisporobacter ferrooxydans TaxID=2901836 RepID=A0ABY4CF52_9BACL|nr:hypothetical protein LSG31_13985 [Alicyclobacillaceae bacterium MYW30-H2]